MPDPSPKTSRSVPRRASRRAAMAAGIATIAGVATPAAAPAAPMQAPGPGAWTPRKAAFNRQGRQPNPLLSHAVRSGPLLFVSGIGGWYPQDREDPGDARVQIDSALKAMRLLLEQSGSTMANVLKVHMTIADPNENLAAINEGYRGHFPDPPPARSYSGCGAAQMGRKGVLVQVDCIAYVE